MDKITLIVTTRCIPEWDVDFYINGMSKCDLDLDLRNNKKFTFDEQVGIGVKRKSFPDPTRNSRREFSVYVAPCLNAEKEDYMKAKKASYLERLVEKVVEKEKESELFLVAHEKDFCVDKTDVFVTEEMLFGKEAYPKLTWLVEKQRVYLFQHDPTGMMYKYIKKIPKKIDVFGYDDCTKMLKVITLLVEMMNRFKEVDEDANSYYQS